MTQGLIDKLALVGARELNQRDVQNKVNPRVGCDSFVTL